MNPTFDFKSEDIINLWKIQQEAMDAIETAMNNMDIVTADTEYIRLQSSLRRFIELCRGHHNATPNQVIEAYKAKGWYDFPLPDITEQ